jgi:hypothetical protein
VFGDGLLRKLLNIILFFDLRVINLSFLLLHDIRFLGGGSILHAVWGRSDNFRLLFVMGPLRPFHLHQTLRRRWTFLHPSIFRLFFVQIFQVFIEFGSWSSRFDLARVNWKIRTRLLVESQVLLRSCAFSLKHLTGVHSDYLLLIHVVLRKPLHLLVPLFGHFLVLHAFISIFSWKIFIVLIQLGLALFLFL